MTKRPSLFSTPAHAAPQAAPAPAPVMGSTEAPAEAVQASTAAPAKTHRPKSREGKRVVSVYVSEAAWKQLRLLGIDLGLSTQALGEEALNLLFEKHRRNRIA